MRKSLFGFLFLATSLFSFGQVSWSGSAEITARLYINGTMEGASSRNVSATGGFFGFPQTAQLGFSFGNYYYEFNLANGDATSLSYNSNANLRLYINNQEGSSLSFPANTLKFELTFPATTAGAVTGFSVVSDTYNILPNFSVSSNGSGVLTLTQTSAFTTGGNAENLIGNFTTSAVPEPSTYAALAGLMVLGVAGIVRRRQRSAEAVVD